MPSSVGHSSSWWKEPFEKAWYPLPSIASEWTVRTKQEAKTIKNILDLPRGSRVLDVGCGVGRHAIALAKLGFQVTGIDISPKFLQIAQSNARKAGVKIDFYRCDMRQLPFKQEFHAALNLFTSFGYFPKASDDLSVLKGICRALYPSGTLIIDTLNYAFIKTHFLAESWTELNDGTLMLERRTPPDEATQILKSNWVFITPNGKRSEMHSQIRGYTKIQLSKLMKTAGFRKIDSHPPLSSPSLKMPVFPRLVLSGQI